MIKTEYDFVRIKKFIDGNTWTFAKTYAKTAPHEYLIYDKLDSENQKEYLWFANCIKKDGVDGKFYNAVLRYFYFGKHKYWLGNTDSRKDGVLNRDNKSEQYKL